LTSGQILVKDPGSSPDFAANAVRTSYRGWRRSCAAEARRLALNDIFSPERSWPGDEFTAASGLPRCCASIADMIAATRIADRVAIIAVVADAAITDTVPMVWPSLTLLALIW
jgi:hypothetical protein